MEILLSPTDEELAQLREQLRDAKRQREYVQLKQDLHQITVQGVNTPNEFDGAMQIPDTHKVLHSKHTTKYTMDLLIERIKAMLAVRPILGNIIALLLATVALYYVFNEIQLKAFGGSRHYFAIGIAGLAGFQIIKSATRSLLLLLLAIACGGLISHQLGTHQALFYFHPVMYQALMVVGIVGLGVAIFTID